MSTRTMTRMPGGRLATALLLIGLAGAAPAQGPAQTAPLVSATSTITREQIDKRIEQVSAVAEMDAAAKTKLLELYRKAQGFLDDARKSSDTRESFRRVANEAPAEISRLREAAEPAKAPAAVALPPAMTLTEIEQRLQKEKADLASLEALATDLQRVVSDAETRPTVIRQRLPDARKQLEKLEEDRKAPAAPEDTPAVAEARRWLTEAQIAALTAEMRMLDEELLTAPARIELAKAREEEAARKIDGITARVATLESQLSERRRAEAEQAKAEAKAAERETAGKHPLLQRVAEQNAALSEELAAAAGRLEKLVAEQKDVEQRSRQLDEDFRSAKKKLEIAGLSEILAQVLLEQRRVLSDERGVRARAAHYRSAAEREQATAEAGLRQIRYADERKSLSNLAAHVEALLRDLAPSERAAVRTELSTLVASRRELLDKALFTQESYLRGLAELEFLQQQLDETVSEYGQFLDERLLWIRSTPAVSIERLRALPRDALRILFPPDWLAVAAALPAGLLRSPALLVALLAVTALFVRSPWIRRRLEACGKEVGRVTTDKYPKTLEALGWTMLLALRWPAVFAVAGWALQAQGVSLLPLSAANDELALHPEVGSFAESVGRAIGGLALPLFILSGFRLLCLPRGVGESHFRWDKGTTELLRRATGRLIAGLIPAAFLAVLILGREGAGEPGALGPVVFLAITIALTLYFWRVLHPRKGALRGFLADHPNGILARLRYVWFPVVVALPLWLTGLALAGYLYTAGTVAGAVVRTLYLVFGLVVARELVVRWLVLVHRRLKLKALRERRAAERAAAEQPAGDEAGLQIEEPEVDLAALSEESTKLLGTGLTIAGALGTWAIWADILPALAIFEKVELWHYPATVDGVEKQIPLTLADVGLAAILIFVTVVATRRLPSLLEIVLLHRLDVGSANRFTVTTLSRYVIVLVGAILVFNALGGSWSEIQWLVAALGVGIGFGLQEIVANFISGLIILFERPLRVGDAVTVGDTEGVVSRIQIRATTITTWDRRELLVPNKEFITGRLLNWSLSDTVTRIEVPVGVDYGADVKLAMALMADAAQKHERVLKDPKPMVIFQSFGDNSLLLSLRCFVGSIDHRLATLSELHSTINDRFAEAGIGIAFPQRDVHLYTGQPLQVRVVGDGTGAGPV